MARSGLHIPYIQSRDPTVAAAQALPPEQATHTTLMELSVGHHHLAGHRTATTNSQYWQRQRTMRQVEGELRLGMCLDSSLFVWLRAWWDGTGGPRRVV